MKKFFITSVLSLTIVFLLLAQPKKPAQTQAKKTGAAQTKSFGAATQASIERGREVYSKVCVACHQKDGGGVPRLNPPLAKTEWVTGDKARLIRIVLKGLNEPIEIDGEEYSNAMPPQPQLTDQQIADVLTFVRNNFGNKASAITPTEVKAQRAKTS